MKFAKDKSELSDGAIVCRGLGHKWDPYKAPIAEARTFKGYNVTLICKSCGTMKHFMLSFRGEYYPATYTYADDYLLMKGNAYITREDKGQFKLQALSEILPQQVATVTNIKTKAKEKKHA